MTKYKQSKSSAINDNTPVRRWGLQTFLMTRSAGALSERIRRIEHTEQKSSLTHNYNDAQSARSGPQDSFLTDTSDMADRYAYDNEITEIYEPEALRQDAPNFGAQMSNIPPKLLPIFLIVFGFALTSILTLLYVLAVDRYNGLINILMPAIMLSGFALMAMRWTIALWGSLCLLFLWSGLAITAKYYGQNIPASQWLLALPIILSLQIIAARYLRGTYIMFAALACAYIWLAIFTLGSDLSALASGSLVFTLGTAHHRLGKAWADIGSEFSHHHTLIGWVAAMTGLVWAQHYFISLGQIGASTAGIRADQSVFWFAGIVLALAAIFISNIMRMRHERLSLLGCLSICLGALILPAIAYKPAILSVIFEPLTSLPATPYFGFALSAIVISVAVAFGMNGLRRRHFFDSVIAGLAICLQFAIIMNPDYFNFDTLIVMLLTILLVTSGELIIARRSILSSPIYQNN